MAVEVPSEGRDVWRREEWKEEKESVLSSVGEEQIGGGAYTLRNDREEELLREMLTPT